MIAAGLATRGKGLTIVINDRSFEEPENEVA